MENAQALTPIQEFKKELYSAGITAKLGSMMPPRKMARFKSQLLQIVTANSGLQTCTPLSVISAALAAANVGLDISPAFGQAAVIPFNNTVDVWDEKQQKMVKRKQRMAQLQIMTKGWTQLSLRSGQFSWINADAVYEDEYQGADLLSGMVYLRNVPDGFRSKGMKERIVGFFAAYELTNGGRKVLYMNLRDIEAHARTYSKPYRNYNRWPIEDDWMPNLYGVGLGWNENWFAMARKTVLKLLIQRWAPISTEIEEALEADQAAFADLESGPIYVETESQDELPAEKKQILASKSKGAAGLEALLSTKGDQETAAAEPMPTEPEAKEMFPDPKPDTKPFSVPQGFRGRKKADEPKPMPTEPDDGLSDDMEADGDEGFPF